MRLDEERSNGTSPGLREDSKNDYADRNSQTGMNGLSTQPADAAHARQAQPDAVWSDEMEIICRQELELHNIEVHQRIVRFVPAATV